MDRFPHTGPGGSFTSPHSPPPYLEGHEATLHCDPGYTLPSTTRRTARVVTQHDGTLAWEPHTLNCLPVSCGAPPDIPAHGYLTAQNFTFPHAFSYACEPGYRLEPPPPRPNVFYCGVTGHWTPALPSTTPVHCERVQCPPLAPPPPPNSGSVHLTDRFFFGSVATYRCNPPHVRVRGEASRTCQADGQWSGGEEVECGEVQCPPPLVVEELLQARVVYASPQLQIIACNEGQQVVVVKCLASGRWSKDPPYCSTTTTQTKPPAAGGAAAAAAATAVGGTAAVEPVVKPMSVVLLFLVIGMIVWVLWIYYPWKGKEKKNK